MSGRVLWAVLLAGALPPGGAAQEVNDRGGASAESNRGGAEVAAIPTTRPGVVIGEISIDGHLDEEAWKAAPVATGFVQREPVEGDPAEHDTQVRVLLTADAVYIGALLLDPEPWLIADQLVRRDEQGQFDFFEISLDPNLDHRTGYTFQVSAANVQADRFLFDDQREDRAWDAVWDSEVSRDERGWTVEVRIPLSQIRYESSDSTQTWGINFSRQRLRNNERTYFALQSRLQRGTVSQFGLLEGVELSSASRRLEVRPYVLSSSHRAPATDGDPFFDGSDLAARTGLEMSYGLGAAFTIDATVNPDFGQVEADPSVINLSAFETFFREQRPFFVENAQVFDFSLSGRQNQLFYSRRLGRAPQGGTPSGADFTDVPAAATILGAAKLSGRTSSGLSVGALAAVTQEETGNAFFAADGRNEEFVVEPKTQYGVLRVMQDLNGGASQVGGIFTAMNRDLPEDGSFDFLTNRAFNGGIDFEHQWGNREWALSGWIAGSYVEGDSTALIRLQRSSNHYFQRPDNSRLAVDSTATSMGGIDWRVQFDRRSGTHWTGGLWVAESTSGFEINDVGFSRTAARLDAGTRVTYREIKPGPTLRSYNLTFTTFHNWTHEALDNVWSAASWGRAHVAGSFSLRGGVQFLNYWSLNGDLAYRPDKMSRTATRGGPLIRDPSSWNGGLRLQTDRRARFSVQANFNVTRGQLGSGDQFRTGLELSVRPSPRLELEIEPKFTTQTEGAQYVTSTQTLPFEPTYGTRYVFADLDRRSLSMETRLNVTFTPDLTLQLFAQPLISSVDYVSYKQLLASGTFDFDTFDEGVYVESGDDVLCQGGRICRNGDDQFVDLDNDGTADFSFSDRDFNQRTLISNAVLRWEYRPGSTIFLVWQHRQFEREDIGDFAFGRDVSALFGAPSDDVFILKVNYWLGL